MSSFFNAPVKIPKGTGLNIENTNNDVMSLKASQSAFTGGNFTLYFPNTYGTSNQVLKTDGAGNLSWTAVTASSIAADDITVGDSNVYISTTTGNVRVNAPSGENVQLQVSNANVAVFTGSAVTLVQATTISSTTQSISTTTGALIVSGGAGIASNVFVGGNVNVASSVESISFATGALVVSGGAGVNSNLYVGGNVKVSSSVESTAITNGALVVSGGAGITSNLYVGGNVKVTNEAILSSNLFVNGTTESTNSGSGSLIILGGAGIAKNINVGGNLTVTNATTLNGAATVQVATESTSTTTGALIVSGGVGIASNVNIGGNLTVTKQVIYGVNNFTADSNVAATATPLWTNTSLATIKHLQPPKNEAQFYHSNTSISYITGQHMDVFFTRATANTTATANIDFGSSNLYSGTGTAQYLVFTQPGQSASLVYLGGDDSIKGWRIVNTGAQVF